LALWSNASARKEFRCNGEALSNQRGR